MERKKIKRTQKKDTDLLIALANKRIGQPSGGYITPTASTGGYITPTASTGGGIITGIVSALAPVVIPAAVKGIKKLIGKGVSEEEILNMPDIRDINVGGKTLNNRRQFYRKAFKMHNAIANNLNKRGLIDNVKKQAYIRSQVNKLVGKKRYNKYIAKKLGKAKKNKKGGKSKILKWADVAAPYLKKAASRKIKKSKLPKLDKPYPRLFIKELMGTKPFKQAYNPSEVEGGSIKQKIKNLAKTGLTYLKKRKHKILPATYQFISEIIKNRDKIKDGGLLYKPKKKTLEYL